jgi:hypothetical protein
MPPPLREPDVFHCVAKQLAILGHVDGFARGRDQLDSVFLEHALANQVERAIQCGLPTHRGQQRARPLLGNDFRDRAPVNGLDVDGIGARGIGHDRRGVRVDQDNSVALVLERLARLRSGVIEFARLPDDDGAGTDDQNAFEIVTAWH